MESDGILLIFKEFHKQYQGQIYYDRVVIDDDTEYKIYDIPFLQVVWTE